MKPSHAPRGFTLMEMVIAMGVSSLVLVSALLLAQSQQRTYYGSQKGRAAQSSGRSALLFLEQTIALAGYGLDPAHALDFAWYGCAGGCTRDLTDGPDELVFYARNPAYRVVEQEPPLPALLYGRTWETTAIDGDSVTLTVRDGQTFRNGQILQLLCTGELIFTYATVGETVTAGADGPLEIELLPVSPGTLASGTPADPFRRQDMALAANAEASKWNGCLGNKPRAFQVDRYRFYVRVEDMGDGRSDPYLVLDTGVDTDGDDDVDEDDELLVAEGIENLQVAYGFIDPSLPAAGAEPGTQITVPAVGTTPDATVQTLTPTDFPGDYDATKVYPPLHSTWFFTRSSLPLADPRKTNAQGNVRVVRVVLVGRSPEPSPDTASNLRYDPGSPLWVLNFDAAPAWITDFATARGGDDGYQRSVLETSVRLPNLASRGLAPN